MRSDCPSNETLAAFIDGRLPARDRSALIRHRVACSDCDAFVVDATAIREAIGEADFEPRGFAPREARRGNVLPFRTIAAVAAVAAAIATVFFVPAVREMVPVLRSPGIEELASVADAERTIDVRIAAIHDHRPRAATYRSANEQKHEKPELLDKAAAVEEAADAHATPRNLHALGVAWLLRDKPAEAIQALERAKKLDPADAALLSDLAAAYAERGSRADDERALAYADEAMRLAKTPAAAWNRALALDHLGRTADAKAAWAQYLALETDPAWRSEAQERLAFLNEFGAR